MRATGAGGDVARLRDWQTLADIKFSTYRLTRIYCFASGSALDFWYLLGPAAFFLRFLGGLCDTLCQTNMEPENGSENGSEYRLVSTVEGSFSGFILIWGQFGEV